MTHKIPAPTNSAPETVAALQPSAALAAAAIVAATAHSQSAFETAMMLGLSLFVVAESARHQMLAAAVGEAAAEQWGTLLWQTTHLFIPTLRSLPKS